MFSEAWMAITCFSIPILSNLVTFNNTFYITQGDKKALKTGGWLILLLGNMIPIAAIFFTAARAGRMDEGLWVGAVFGVLFVIRIAWELGNIAKTITGNTN